ncbi:MAG: hypothetical protein AAGC57_10895 [Pseudomonadota bacterium]
MDAKTKIEYIRVATMIAQKIDVIWVTFLTTYIALFGFAIFYDRGIDLEYYVVLFLFVGIFTWINGRSLRNHYRLLYAMGEEFERLSGGDFPGLVSGLRLYKVSRDAKFIIAIHGLSGFTLIWLVIDRFSGVDFWMLLDAFRKGGGAE